MSAKTYDFKQVACILGTRQITGFAEGDSISVEYESNLFNTVIGADGEATRSKSNNRSAKVTLKLLKTSLANDILNEYYQSDVLSNGGTFPFLLKDNNGSELHAAEQMWVEKEPTAPFGQEAPVREWTLKTALMISSYGGNV
jgi:hypothetical protein